MLQARLSALALVGALFLPVHHCDAQNIVEEFSPAPLSNGWSIFGSSDLFHWDSANQQLNVTWDSTQPNSFFYHPLPGYLTRHDDFKFEFDLEINDITTGSEAGKPGPLQLGIGFQKWNTATNSSFLRGYGNVSDIAEFCYFPYGYYDYFGMIYDAPATAIPSFVSSLPTFSGVTTSPYEVVFPLHTLIHISMTYTASNQTATVMVTTNGIPLVTLPEMVLNSANGNFSQDDDFHVDMFSITSYTGIGDDYDSLLAHGSVANLKVTLPPPAQNLVGGFSNGLWQVQFYNHTNWVYTLQRTTNFIHWTDVSIPTPGNDDHLLLQDLEASSDHAFYRVNAARP
jgi:hypothetical protein